MTEFTIWCLVASLMFNIGGIHYKFFPPKKFKMWGHGVRIPSALRNQDTWNEGNQYTAFLSFIAGSLFVVIARLPSYHILETVRLHRYYL